MYSDWSNASFASFISASIVDAFVLLEKQNRDKESRSKYIEARSVRMLVVQDDIPSSAVLTVYDTGSRRICGGVAFFGCKNIPWVMAGDLL